MKKKTRPTAVVPPPVVVIVPAAKEQSFSNAPITHTVWHAIVTFTAPVHDANAAYPPAAGTISSFHAGGTAVKPAKRKKKNGKFA